MSRRLQVMVCENDIFEIPEKYKKMTLSELKAEKERIYKTWNPQKTGTVREKIDACPIKFNI